MDPPHTTQDGLSLSYIGEAAPFITQGVGGWGWAAFGRTSVAFSFIQKRGAVETGTKGDEQSLCFGKANRSSFLR